MRATSRETDDNVGIFTSTVSKMGSIGGFWSEEWQDLSVKNGLERARWKQGGQWEVSSNYPGNIIAPGTKVMAEEAMAGFRLGVHFEGWADVRSVVIVAVIRAPHKLSQGVPT